MVQEARFIEAKLKEVEVALAESKAQLSGVLDKLAKSEADAETELNRLRRIHAEDIRVTNESADFHIKECAKLRQQLADAEARTREAVLDFIKIMQFIHDECDWEQSDTRIGNAIAKVLTSARAKGWYI